MVLDWFSTHWLRNLLFIGFALLLSVYVLIEPRTHGSFWIDYVWAKQFASQFADGEPYPRWLENSFNGIGAPVFYFYAPLAFYLIAIFSPLGIWEAILCAFILLHAASGAAMHQWLGGGRSRTALLGALVYMALPYHLIDFGRRGAIAEFAAYAFIPLVALCLRRAIERHEVSLLALAYAGLILSHLPMALLVSLFLIPALVMHLGRGKGLAPVGIGLALGLGIAAVYWLPAVALQDQINPILWGRHFSPPYWRFTNLLHWEEKRETWLIAAAILASAGAATVMLWRRRPSFWPVATIFLCLVAANVIPGLWSIPILAKVQFPWRTTALVEFSLVTAGIEALRSRIDRKRLLVAFTPLLILSVAVVALPLPAGPDSHRGLDQTMPDVPEYRRAELPANGKSQITAEGRGPILAGQLVSLISILILAACIGRRRTLANRRLPR